MVFVRQKLGHSWCARRERGGNLCIELLQLCQLINWRVLQIQQKELCMQAADYFADDVLLEDLCKLLAHELFLQQLGSCSGTDITAASQRTGLKQSQQAEQAHVQLDQAATVSGSRLEHQASQVLHCLHLCLDAYSFCIDACMLYST
jgi:hypothetical protein